MKIYLMIVFHMEWNWKRLERRPETVSHPGQGHKNLVYKDNDQYSVEKWVERIGWLSLKHWVSLEVRAHTQQKVQCQNEKLSIEEGLCWWAKEEISKESPKYGRDLHVFDGACHMILFFSYNEKFGEGSYGMII